MVTLIILLSIYGVSGYILWDIIHKHYHNPENVNTNPDWLDFFMVVCPVVNTCVLIIQAGVYILKTAMEKDLLKRFFKINRERNGEK